MNVGQSRVETTWRSGLEPIRALQVASAELKHHRAKVVVGGEDSLTATGGSRLAYRLLGSSSPGIERWMPWRASITVIPAEFGGWLISLVLTSDQGTYAYQGARTAQKWQRLLERIAADLQSQLG